MHDIIHKYLALGVALFLVGGGFYLLIHGQSTQGSFEFDFSIIKGRLSSTSAGFICIVLGVCLTALVLLLGWRRTKGQTLEATSNRPGLWSRVLSKESTRFVVGFLVAAAVLVLGSIYSGEIPVAGLRGLVVLLTILAGVYVFFVVVGLFLAILTPFGQPAFSEAMNAAKETQCLNNLGQIGRLLELYRKNHGGPNYMLPEETGLALLKKLQSTVAIAENGAALFACPFRKAPKGTITYRGPSKNVNMRENYDMRDIIVCCEGAHPDGSIMGLTKGYQVVKVPREDGERYKLALDSTSSG